MGNFDVLLSPSLGTEIFTHCSSVRTHLPDALTRWGSSVSHLGPCVPRVRYISCYKNNLRGATNCDRGTTACDQNSISGVFSEFRCICHPQLPTFRRWLEFGIYYDGNLSDRKATWMNRRTLICRLPRYVIIGTTSGTSLVRMDRTKLSSRGGPAYISSNKLALVLL